MRSTPGGRRAAALLAGLLALVVCALPALSADTYELDPVHSQVTFKIRHFFGMVPGRFSEPTGTVVYDAENPENSTVEISVPTANIDTNNDKRDPHLRSDDFFNAEKYPNITFKSTKVEKTDKPNFYKVTGDLTIRDVTKPVVVDVEMLGIGDLGPMGYRASLIGTTKINRLDYGVKWNKVLDGGGTLLGDEVQIEFPIEMIKKAT